MSTNSNIWANSKLNKDNLNVIYLSSFDSTWQSKIAMTTWKVGGNTYNNIMHTNPATAYQNEIVGPNPGTYGNNITEEPNKKIGLMYVSDYMYGASQTYWIYKRNDTATTDYRSAIDENWIYGGWYEWTITRTSDYDYYAFTVSIDGSVRRNIVYNIVFAGRPCFYLNSDVMKIDGVGTVTAPYIIK